MLNTVMSKHRILSMTWIITLPAILVVWAMLTGEASASAGPDIHGGGNTGASGETRFALAITNGTGHFECLMPSIMTVEATVTKVNSATSTSATFEGTAQVTLAVNNPFGLRSGPMGRDVPFTASVIAGGPGVGSEDLEIMGMSFPGTVDHGQISITP
jgi:hypothetical protein